MKRFLALLAVIQVLLAVPVFARLIATANGRRIRRQSDPVAGRVSVLVPVLNEEARLEPCLARLAAQGDDVAEILVIDGGSTDGTRALVCRWMERDVRFRLIDAAPVPEGVNGKAHGLRVGLEHASAATDWVLTIDADVRPQPMLARSLLAHAAAEGVQALSAATLQRVSGSSEALLHPSMLTTLVYRYGIPGHATDRVERVQANGQCFLVRRDLLEAIGGFDGVLDSVCEDVTLARAIAGRGTPVGFYETEGLVAVEMYAGWREAWDNWMRSLPMRDRFSGPEHPRGLAEVVLVQALPLWLAPIAWLAGGRRHPAAIVNGALLAARLGVLAGTARAYERRPWSYWLSPLCDLPVALQLFVMSCRRHHTWRGRAFVSGGLA